MVTKISNTFLSGSEFAYTIDELIGGGIFLRVWCNFARLRAEFVLGSI